MAWTFSGFLKGMLIQNEVDRSKELVITVDASATTGTRTTIVAAQTANRTITLPDGNATLVTTSSAQTLTNKTMDGDDNTFSDIGIASLKTDLAAANTFISRNGSGAVISTKAVPTGAVVGISDSQTLTNKSIDADANTITNIENADIKAAAAIALNKLAATTASRALVSDGSGFISPATTTAAEIGFVNGVTSAIQTQLNAKQSSTLTSAHILVGNGSNLAADVAMSGDIAIANTGATTYTGVVPLNKGGTGTAAGSANAAFNALSPMTTLGDVIIGGSSGAGTRLGIGTANQVLTSFSGAPAWRDPQAASAVLVIQTKTATYTALTSDDLILVSGGTFDINLYTAVGNTGRVLRVKKTDSSLTNVITLVPNGAETIDGDSSVSLYTGNEEFMIVSDGTNWQILQHYASSLWTNAGATTITGVSVNPTKGSGTTVDAVYWRRVGANAEIRMAYRHTSAGTAGTGNYLFAMPTNLVIDVSKLNAYTTSGTNHSTFANSVGIAQASDNGANNSTGSVVVYDANRVRFYAVDFDEFIGSSANPLTATVLSYTCSFSVPISGWYP